LGGGYEVLEFREGGGVSCEGLRERGSSFSFFRGLYVVVIQIRYRGIEMEGGHRIRVTSGDGNGCRGVVALMGVLDSNSGSGDFSWI